MSSESMEHVLESSQEQFRIAMDVRRKVIEARNDLHVSKARFARVLAECHDNKYWAPDYKSFKEYADTEIGIGLRAAQQLVKTWKVCAAHGITEEQMAEIGWSKLAITAPFITAGNVSEVVERVKKATCSQLKDEFKKQASADQSGSADSPKLIITEVILRAMQMAATLKLAATEQECLEAVASHFVSSARGQGPSRRFEMN